MYLTQNDSVPLQINLQVELLASLGRVVCGPADFFMRGAHNFSHA